MYPDFSFESDYALQVVVPPLPPRPDKTLYWSLLSKELSIGSCGVHGVEAAEARQHGGGGAHTRGGTLPAGKTGLCNRCFLLHGEAAGISHGPNLKAEEGCQEEGKDLHSRN